ncbi:LexA family transcriptional regulator [Methylobacterium tarhaniae]|uniref:LexA family transcriptional regulator n=1 Tax=Methylobacterium tarhaniae TaxID=1187852 RepID=UPI003CFE5388
MTEPHDRLKAARERAGYADATSAAKAFNWNATTYRSHENGTRGLKIGVAQKYAKAFRVSAAWIMTGEGDAPSALDTAASEVVPVKFKPVAIPIIGKTEAGTFREVVEYDDEEHEYVFDEPDPEFPRARQVAFLVEGDSMNQADPPILPGAKLICVDFEETGLPLIEGMIVVVERTQDGGQSREWSVKEVELDGENTIFAPRSSNKRHKPIIMRDDPDIEEAKEAHVIALVRNVSYSVKTGKRRRSA